MDSIERQLATLRAERDAARSGYYEIIRQRDAARRAHANTTRERDAERKAHADTMHWRDAALREIERLESLRPHWTQGYSSDGVAAQVKKSALDQIWDALGVADQTAAMARIAELLAERDAARPQIEGMREALGAFVPHYEAWMNGCADDAPLDLYRGGRTFGMLRSAHAALAPAIAGATR